MRPRTIVTDEGVHRSGFTPHSRCGKFLYASKKQARALAKRIRRERLENVEAYHCYPCHGYHVGHVPGEPRKLAPPEG